MSTVFAANNTWDIQASGGDFDSLHVAIANDTTISSGDTLFIIQHKRFDTTTSTTPVNFAGWTNNGVIYIKAADSLQTDGTPNDAKATYGLRQYWTIDGNAGNIVIEHIRWRSAGTYIISVGSAGSPTVTIKECVFEGNGASAFGSSAQSAGTWTFVNSIFMNFSGSVFYYSGGTNNMQQDMYNCTFTDHNRVFTIINSDMDLWLENCLFNNRVGTAHIGSFSTNAGFVLDVNACAADDAAFYPDSGSGNRSSQTFTFTDEASDEFYLSTSDAGARTYGNILSSITTIDGREYTRGSTWDIGAFEAEDDAGSSPTELRQRRRRILWPH